MVDVSEDDQALSLEGNGKRNERTADVEVLKRTYLTKNKQLIYVTIQLFDSL